MVTPLSRFTISVRMDEYITACTTIVEQDHGGLGQNISMYAYLLTRVDLQIVELRKALMEITVYMSCEFSETNFRIVRAVRRTDGSVLIRIILC